jgi:alkanesulfonate monooxygenase SsuD/methylene tetrahydromethanopterin reductase-like flavin-dependent oxidoreductase (luciferase family)
MHLRFGLYCELQAPPAKSHAELYAEFLEQVEHADRVGFDVYSIIDHHFFPEFSISANPLALIAAAAQRTRRLRFRVALHTLPLANPMRLAGEIAVADILSGGRLETGLGRGHAWLFERSAVDLVESRGRFEEAVEILQRGLDRGQLQLRGEVLPLQEPDGGAEAPAEAASADLHRRHEPHDL